MSRRFEVFVNGAAGSVSESDDESAQIVTAFADHGVEATVNVIDPADLPGAMRAAWTTGVEAIIIAGGDGSVNCAAGAAAGTDMVIGVLPMGTFNHFAKDLGVPTGDIAAAVEWLARATVTTVDIGEVNGRAFVNNASIGVYPKMVADRDKIREQRGWGKIRAVPVAVVRTLQHLPVHRLRLTLDGAAPVTVSTAFLFVGNGLFDDHGERLATRTSLTDQRLGVYVITTTRRWRLVYNAIKSRVRGIASASQTERRVAEHFVIESDEALLTIALDGEPTEVKLPLTFLSRPAALRVLAVTDDA